MQRNSCPASAHSASTVEEAEQLARDEEHRIAALIASFEPVTNGGAIDLASFYAGNLISGVVTATE